jgi:hypothetical protein
MEIKTGQKRVYVDSSLQAEFAAEQSIESIVYEGNAKTGEGSNYPGDKLEDKHYRSDEFRSGLNRHEGVLCITVKAGSAFLGDIELCVQYEGPKDSGKDEPDLCVHRQNDLMLHAANWIQSFLQENMAPDSKWEIDMDAHPCPKSKVPLQLPQMLLLVEGKTTLQNALKVNVDSTVEHNPHVGNEVRSSGA